MDFQAQCRRSQHVEIGMFFKRDFEMGVSEIADDHRCDILGNAVSLRQTHSIKVLSQEIKLQSHLRIGHLVIGDIAVIHLHAPVGIDVVTASAEDEAVALSLK